MFDLKVIVSDNGEFSTVEPKEYLLTKCLIRNEDRSLYDLINKIKLDNTELLNYVGDEALTEYLRHIHKIAQLTFMGGYNRREYTAEIKCGKYTLFIECIYGISPENAVKLLLEYCDGLNNGNNIVSIERTDNTTEYTYCGAVHRITAPKWEWEHTFYLAVIIAKNNLLCGQFVPDTYQHNVAIEAALRILAGLDIVIPTEVLKRVINNE